MFFSHILFCTCSKVCFKEWGQSGHDYYVKFAQLTSSSALVVLWSYSVMGASLSYVIPITGADKTSTVVFIEHAIGYAIRKQALEWAYNQFLISYSIASW